MHPLLRYTLDLFDTTPPAPAENAPRKRARSTAPDKHFKPNGPLALVDKAQEATKNIAIELGDVTPVVPAISIHQALAPAVFAHPRANRELRVADAVVSYVFERARRRTIGFMVGPDGLVVRAPRWTPLAEVDAALQTKAPWILRKLGETRERKARRDDARIEWQDGVCFPFLGEQIRVVLDPSHAFGAVGAQLQPMPADPAADMAAPPRVLRVGLSTLAAPAQIRDAVQAWLMRQAQAHFAQRLDHFAPLLGVQWRKLALSSAGTRWGSARIDGSIRLNWRLIHFRPAVIDYVVVHELSHLRVMDHSPRFWDTVGTVVPDYAVLRRQLRDDAMPLWS